MISSIQIRWYLLNIFGHQIPLQTGCLAACSIHCWLAARSQLLRLVLQPVAPVQRLWGWPWKSETKQQNCTIVVFLIEFRAETTRPGMSGCSCVGIVLLIFKCHLCESLWCVFWRLGTHHWKGCWELMNPSIGVPRRVFPQILGARKEVGIDINIMQVRGSPNEDWKLARSWQLDGKGSVHFERIF